LSQSKKGKKNQSRNGNYLLTALKLNLVMTVELKIGPTERRRFKPSDSWG